VPPRQEVVVYCLGEVAQPGALRFSSSERLTVLAAVARAGGLTARASRQILIKRTHRNGGEEEIQADYKRIVAGKDPDVELTAGDVLVVKESFF
jgi:protein involved in polysaccharide export with SLBB domain